MVWSNGDFLYTQVIGNDKLIFGDPTCLEEILSFSGAIVQKIMDIVIQEPSQVT